MTRPNVAYRATMVGRIFCDLVDKSLYKAPESGDAKCDGMTERDWQKYRICVLLLESEGKTVKQLHRDIQSDTKDDNRTEMEELIRLTDELLVELLAGQYVMALSLAAARKSVVN